MPNIYQSYSELTEFFGLEAAEMLDVDLLKGEHPNFEKIKEQRLFAIIHRE